MPQLKWEPVDVLECLAVEPVIEERYYEFTHTYEVHRKGLRLRLVVRQLDSSIEVFLYREGSQVALVSFLAYVRGEVRYINDERGTYLQFENCILAPDALWFVDTRGRVWESNEFRSLSKSIMIAVDPDFRIEFSRNAQ